MRDNFTELEIIEGCKKGIAKYQEALYNRFSAKMMSICIRYSKDVAEAEDNLQEAFIRVFSRIHQYNGGSFAAWVRQVFVSVCINAYRKNKKYQKNQPLHEVFDQENHDPDIFSQISADEIHKKIEMLPHGYRMVFCLYVVEGYSHREIAEKLGISEGTSKSQLSKSRVLLKKMLLEDNPQFELLVSTKESIYELNEKTLSQRI
jgi:RNA polymerase sigma-70 factor (ECF subfamily)